MRIYSHNIWGNFSSKECIGNRNYLIKELIDGVNPDFCCFQECNPSTSRFGETSISKLRSPLSWNINLLFIPRGQSSR